MIKRFLELPSTLNGRGKAFIKISRRPTRKPISKQRLKTVSEKTVDIRKCGCYFRRTFTYLQQAREFRSEIYVSFYTTNFKRIVVKMYCVEYNILRVYVRAGAEKREHSKQNQKFSKMKKVFRYSLSSTKLKI